MAEFLYILIALFVGGVIGFGGGLWVASHRAVIAADVAKKISG